MGVGSGVQGEAWVSSHMMKLKGKSLDGAIGMFRQQSSSLSVRPGGGRQLREVKEGRLCQTPE